MAATSFDLVINAAYKGKGAFKQAQADVQNLERDAQKGASAMKLSASTIAAGIGVATAAIGAAALATKAAWSELNRGAALIQTRTQFENLAASIGATADVMLGKMREATAGMMSDAQLIASASDIISLGLADTEDQAVRLAAVVGQLGWDMNQVILTFANNSTMRLDALGLSVESVTKRAKELEAAGMSMDKAFDMAVIEAGEAKVGLLGSAAETTAGKIKKLEAAMANAKDAFSVAFAEGLADSVGELAGGAEALGDNLAYAAQGAASLAAALAGGGIGSLAIAGRAAQLGELMEQFAALGGDTRAFNARFGANRGDIAQMQVDKIKALTDEIERLQKIPINARSEWEDWGKDVATGAETGAAGLREWTDEAKKAALETAKLADLGVKGVAGANQAGIWAAAGASIDKMLKDAQAEVDALRTGHIDKLAQAFQDVARAAASSFTGAIDAIKNGSRDALVSPTRQVSFVRSGPSQDTRDLLAQYQSGYDKAAKSVRDLQTGVSAFGMSQDQINDKIATGNEQMAYYQSLIDGLGDTTTTYGTKTVDFAFNMDTARENVYQMAVASGASAGQLAELGVALGQFGLEAAEAAVKAAIFDEAMNLLVTDRLLGKINTGDLMASMDEVVTILQNTPPAEIPYVLKQREEDRKSVTIPGKVEIDMSSGDPIITHGQSVTIPAKPDIAGEAVGAAMEAALSGVPESARTIELLGHFAGAEDAGIQAVKQAIDGLDKTIPFIAQMDAVNTALSDLSGKRVSVYVDFIPGGSPTPPGRAAGGPVSSGRPYIVGERGPELFVPRSSGAIIPNGRMNGGGMNVNMTVNFSGPVTDPTKVKDAISDGLAEFFQQVNAAGVSY